jgi:hypothetical protein
MELIDIKSIYLNEPLREGRFLYTCSHFCQQALLNQAPMDWKKIAWRGGRIGTKECSPDNLKS